jgi:hypothetical protein
MEPVALVRLLLVNVRVGCCNASAAVCSNHAASGVSCLVGQHLFVLEENSRDMVACLRVGECAWQDSGAD